jgi:hypothetical protein
MNPLLAAALIYSGNALAPVPHVVYPCVPNHMQDPALLFAMNAAGVAHCQTWLPVPQNPIAVFPRPSLPPENHPPIYPIPPIGYPPEGWTPETVVPEPSTYGMITTGLVGLFAFFRKRK